MKKQIFTLFSLLVFALCANAQVLVWTVGLDDDGWPQGGVGGGPNANFVQETGVNPLPGVPDNPPVNTQADDDYYFAGTYFTPGPGVGAWTTLNALVGANEEAAERAFAGIDNSLRYHSNLPGTIDANDLLSVSWDANNLHIDAAANPDPRYGVEIWFNGIQVATEQLITPAELGVTYTTPGFTLGDVSAVTGPGIDNYVELRGINYNATGGGNWMGVDYVQLDVTAVPGIPEPSTGILTLLGLLGAVAFRRRRR